METSWIAAAKAFVLTCPGGRSSGVVTKGTCWRKMMAAMPTVKPSITGHGMNETVRPSRSRPAAATMIPAMRVTATTACGP